MPHGRYFEVDNDGYLVNDERPEYLVSKWREAAEFVTKSVLERFGPDVHSVWLRGSAARGLAIQGMCN